MAERTLALTQLESASQINRFVKLVRGMLLLGAIGYLGRFIERSIAVYSRAHHLHLPNVEYVLWAIVIGLLMSNTMGVPSVSSRRGDL